MSRPPRLHIDGGFYHVILRGNHREAIFFCPTDRDRFSAGVAEVIERFGMRVHAYCWMTNHVHLLMQVGDVPVGRAIQRIASPYARAVQKRRKTTGHLFERRHRAILIDADSYLLELTRYIHLNPVRAGIVADPADYRWSGHRAYLGLASSPWLTTGFGLSLFDRELHAARLAYAGFVFAGIGQDRDPSLSRGRTDERRVLGEDRFLASLRISRRLRDHHTIEQLIAAVCAAHGLDPEELVRSGRHRKPALIRALIVHHAVERRIATLSALARYFGRGASTLCETLERYRRSQPDLFAAPLDLP
jgi:putative transposase